MHASRPRANSTTVATVVLTAGIMLSLIAWLAPHRQSPSAGLSGKTVTADSLKRTGSPALSAAPVPRACAEAMRRGSDDDNRASDDLEVLAARGLALPVAGARQDTFIDSFSDGRGARKHEALDIHAPRGTPVVAVGDGCVVKLFNSAAGGITLYQFDPQGRFTYYYAHLQRYADGVKEGTLLQRGDVLGYVGTSGNAPPDTPHLHFAIFRLGPEKKWWQGTPVNPFKVFSGPKN